MDTIFALASAPGKAGVAVIRVSGPDAHEAVGNMARKALPDRGMTLCNLCDDDSQVIDNALILSFSAPASFTGEDVVEIQGHGSVASVSAILAELSKQNGCRIAKPGEFTRRALENGKMDLAQVEGLADLIDAETETQRKQAHRLLSGELGRLADGWRTKLIRAASLIEATIDFADEDVPVDVTPEVNALVAEVMNDLERQTQGVRIAERIRTGFEVAIVGPPNAGKSTLLNALAGRKAAITSDVAGTTRDVIEVRMDLAGLPVTILDTAGVRKTDDEVEVLGIELAQTRAAEADVRVFLSDDGKAVDGVDVLEGDIVLRSKADLSGDASDAVSGLTGLGVDQLIERLAKTLENRGKSAGLATRERHKEAMEKALIALNTSTSILMSGPDAYDLAAEELRTAIRALEALVGRIDVENLLDEIFASFCLGK